ncbi:DNA adenine methylase [Bombilactobacillus bombi]|uniref:DNA adenine methylase n=1 Tax=Bombilactobacillus bombi TaxID=1303590 RepID=UPI0015E5C9C1|nr:DNA adenine methylase [Bombilactobacillus bombi]MBA1433677.1 DNA adenine methylase [Bombilactobacillus bombi]
MIIANNLKPVTKWVGGKRQLVSKLIEHLPQDFNSYFEPFIGGGALLLALAPQKAIINDNNQELINVYRVIKDHPLSLLAELQKHQDNNSKEYYLYVRNWDRSEIWQQLTPIQRAARLLYMLRVDFNGLYRVNKKGQFNVPYGKYKNPNIVNRDDILRVSNYFQQANIQILCGDFQKAVASAQKNDLVYFDPPYIPLTSTANFTSYTKDDFTLEDQKRLCQTFFDLARRDVKVMLSNSDTALTRSLYKNANIHIVQARRAINSNAQKRGKINEVIITSY